MKRTLLTGLILIVGAAIVSSMLRIDLETIAAADQAASVAVDAGPVSVPATNPFAPRSDRAQKATRTIKKTVYVPVARSIEVEHSDFLEMQRKEYTFLVLRKAQRMSEEELESAIADLRAELHAEDQAAEAELQGAVDILERLIEQSAGTRAADHARLAIGLLKTHEPSHMPSHQSGGPVYPDAGSALQN